MMKRLLLLACAASLMLAGGLRAQTATINEIEYTVNEDGQSASVTDAGESITTADIPATVAIGGTSYPVTTIGSYAFFFCTSLQSITLPEGLQSIGEYAFYYCSTLQSIDLPQWLQSIDKAAFACCYALKSVTFPQWLQTIGESAFHECTALQSIDLPESLQTIGNYAFHGCYDLQSVTFPQWLQTIGHYAFRYCTTLRSITLPSTLAGIGQMAFKGCPLKDVACLAATPPGINENTFDEETYSGAALHVAAYALASYQAATGWKNFRAIQDDAEEFAGIADVTATPLARYANGILTTSGLADITVYAQSGARVLHATDATSLSLEGLPRGIYIISITQDGQRQVMKVVR